MSERLLNLQEMAAYLNVSTRTLSAHLNDIPHIKIGNRPRFDREQVLEHLAAGKVRITKPKKRVPALRGEGRFAGVLG